MDIYHYHKRNSYFVEGTEWVTREDMEKELEAVKVENKHLRTCAQIAIDAGRSLIGVKKIFDELLKGGE